MRDQIGFEETQRFSAALSVIQDAISNHVFPGIAVAVSHGGAHVLTGGVGNHSYQVPSPKVTAETVYDLASLTKVMGTTAMAMLLLQRGKLELDAPVSSLLPGFGQNGVTVRMLLAHSSGFPGYLPLYKQA